MEIKIIDEKGKSHKIERPPLQPNMLMVKSKVRSSTIVNSDFSHCIFSEVTMFNSRFHECNMEGTAFDNCDLDGAVLSGCSLRGVELINCDVDRLIINGINVGNLLRISMGEIGGHKL
jgi:uncharacterized protein YjbI with pentapeptide repeats